MEYAMDFNAWLRYRGNIEMTDKFCDIHGMYCRRIRRPEGGWTSAECEACMREQLEIEKREKAIGATLNSKLKKTYHVFYDQSEVAPGLRGKDLKNFKAESDADKKALAFARRVARDYQKGTHTGNTIFIGNAGVGKSHLALGIAKELNHQFKTYSENGSVLFMPVASLMSKIKQSFDGRGYYTEEFAKKLLTDCDYLVLDDLGKESTNGNQIKPASPWVYQFLFSILENREKTIVTTNFTFEELRQIYDDSLLDRLTKGSKDYTLKMAGESKR